MKKVLLFIVLCLSLTIPLSSYATSCGCKPQTIFIPEFKASYFRPYSNQIRDIYAEAVTRYDFDLNFRLAPGVWLWSGVGYWKKTSKIDEIPTRFSDIPVTLGIKFTTSLCSGYLRPFIGAGARYDYVRIKNIFRCKNERIDKGGLGAVVTGGVQINTWMGIYLFPFIEYSRNKVRFHHHPSRIFGKSVEVGGFNFGAGVGAWL